MKRGDPSQPVVILGPTAGGKSELAVELAEQLHARGEPLPGVIGADSMQVYRHMDAGTAKPSRKLRQRVPHHLIDIVEPTQRFTVADWLERAREVIASLQSGGKRPIIVGGTNLYLVALLEGMFEGPPADDDFRGSLADIDAGKLHDRLSKVDPESAARIDRNDRKRIVRALEVYEATGVPISALQTQWDSIRHPPSAIRHFQLIGLDWPTDAINQRINLRVKAMFFPEKVDAALADEVCPNGESLPEEVARLEAANLLGPPGGQAREALGYKQVLAAMHGSDPKIKTMNDAFERTKILTRRFAKQQRTWFKRYREAHWVDMHSVFPPKSLVELIVNQL